MKKILLAIIFTLIISSPAFAEKIPVKLENTSLISTHHDEAQLGDYIPFRVVNDIYINKKLYIKKDTKVLGLVDFVQENGWAGYGAEVRFKTFMTKNVDEKVITINSPMILDGNAETFAATTNYASITSPFYVIFMGTMMNVFAFVRGHELGIKPHEATFNIFIEN